MGTWGVGTFENDAASDWVYDLENTRGLSLLTSTIAAVTEAGDYAEARTCENALAAAEVVAALNDRPATYLPDSISTWLNVNARLGASELRSPAVVAIDRILEDSELKDLWEETDDAEKWAATVRDLRDRLSS